MIKKIYFAPCDFTPQIVTKMHGYLRFRNNTACNFGRKMFNIKKVRICQTNSPQNNIFEFPDVPWPGVVTQDFHNILRDLEIPFSHVAKKIAYQGGNIFNSL